MAEQVDLNFIARRLDQLGNDVANMRDDIVVLTAMVSRLEASVTSLVQEMRATHSAEVISTPQSVVRKK
jgi:hypothetical protein